MEIKTTAIIEIAGKPKEHVDKTMDKVIDLASKNKRFKLTKHSKAEVKEVKNLWSTFTEFEIIFPDIDTITGFCFEFMPSSLEILEPEKLNIDSKDIEHMINDVLTRVHQYDMVLKKHMLEQMAKQKEK